MSLIITCLLLSPQLFKDDIMYLLTMDKLWKKRKAPIPLDWQQLENNGMFIHYLRLRSFQLLVILKSEELKCFQAVLPVLSYVLLY